VGSQLWIVPDPAWFTSFIHKRDANRQIGPVIGKLYHLRLGFVAHRNPRFLHRLWVESASLDFLEFSCVHPSEAAHHFEQ
jgi:hypothetical protein